MPNNLDAIRFHGLVAEGRLHEITTIDSEKALRTYYFPTGEQLGGFLASTDYASEGHNVYIGLNPVATPVLRGRRPNRPSDCDIIAIKNIWIDIDRRKSDGDKDRTATDEEQASCLALANSIHDYLLTLNITPKCITSTGNGAGILLSADLATTDQPLVAGFIHHLAQRFDNDQAIVDKSCVDLARMVRLPGTLNIKARSHAPDSPPWRPARIIEAPSNPTTITSQTLADFETKPQHTTTTNQPSKPLKLKITFDELLKRVQQAGAEIIKETRPEGIHALTSGSSFVIAGCPVKGQDDANTWVCVHEGLLRTHCPHHKCAGKGPSHLLKALGIPLAEVCEFKVMEEGIPGTKLGTRLLQAETLEALCVPVPELTEAVLAQQQGTDIVLSTKYVKGSEIPDGWVLSGRTIKYLLEGQAEGTIDVSDSLRAVRPIGGEAKDTVLQLQTDREGWTTHALPIVERKLEGLGLKREERARLIAEAVTERFLHGMYVPFAPPELPNGMVNLGRDWWLLPSREGATPNFDRVLAHIGGPLDSAVAANDWCRANGILTGADYLLCWYASAVQQPQQNLPGLSLVSREQNRCGKSTFSNLMEKLISKKLIQKMTPKSLRGEFTGNLDTAVFIIIEELNLNANLAIPIEIKRRIDASMLETERKGVDAKLTQHFGHYIHTCNDPTYIPLTPDDKRIVCWTVPPVNGEPDAEIAQLLEAEGPAIRNKLETYPLPATKADRCFLPVLMTDLKRELLDGIGTLPEWLVDVAELNSAQTMTAQQIANHARKLGHRISRQKVAAVLADDSVLAQLEDAEIELITKREPGDRRHEITTYQLRML